MILALLRGNWKVALIALAVVAILGFIGNLQLTIARQGRQIGDLRADLSRAVPTISKEDAAALRAGVASVKRDLEGAREEIRRLEGRPGTERIIERRGPAGSPGTPGAPGPPGPAGTPGTPLVLPERAPAERERATERILAFFDEGSLVGCQGPGIPPLTVELLRDPTGRLLSTAPCVWKINDQVFRDPILPPPIARPSPWKGIAAYQVMGGGWGLGVGYTIASVWRVDLDAVALASLPRNLYLGPGVAFRTTERLSLGAAYTYGFTERSPIIWGYLGVRW